MKKSETQQEQTTSDEVTSEDYDDEEDFLDEPEVKLEAKSMMDMELTDPYAGITEMEHEAILNYADQLAAELEQDLTESYLNVALGDSNEQSENEFLQVLQ